jgi:hypothetical protein
MREQVMRKGFYSGAPILHAGEFVGPPEAPKSGNTSGGSGSSVFGNITSIFGSLSNGVSSVFNAISWGKQAEINAQNQAKQKQTVNNTIIWVFAGIVLIVVAFVFLKRK